jgi:hypothetical protein
MSDQKTTPQQKPHLAAEDVAGAHRLLKKLEQKIGEHPELAEAITRLELALNNLTVQTGGML